MANYYAGLSYLKLKDYKQAVEYLDRFSATDELLSPIARGKIGDAFADINQLDDALDYYKKAANLRDNNFTTPLFLFKAGITAMELKKYSQAEKFFTQIKNDYPTSSEAENIDAYISKATYAQQ